MSNYSFKAAGKKVAKQTLLSAYILTEGLNLNMPQQQYVVDLLNVDRKDIDL